MEDRVKSSFKMNVNESTPDVAPGKSVEDHVVGFRPVDPVRDFLGPNPETSIRNGEILDMAETLKAGDIDADGSGMGDKSCPDPNDMMKTMPQTKAK